MKTGTRRDFLATTATFVAGTAALGSVAARAADEHHHHHGAGDGMEVDASLQDTCATCQFWGGMRKVSGDKTKVTVQSMGWCNNPDSPNHQKLTAADHEMKMPGIWKKWQVL